MRRHGRSRPCVPYQARRLRRKRRTSDAAGGFTARSVARGFRMSACPTGYRSTSVTSPRAPSSTRWATGSYPSRTATRPTSTWPPGGERCSSTAATTVSSRSRDATAPASCTRCFRTRSRRSPRGRGARPRSSTSTARSRSCSLCGCSTTASCSSCRPARREKFWRRSTTICSRRRSRCATRARRRPSSCSSVPRRGHWSNGSRLCGRPSVRGRTWPRRSTGLPCGS